MKKENCKNCTFFTAYYRQFTSSYIQSQNGFCGRFGKILKQSDSCPDYRSNEKKEESREVRRLKDLETALKSINDIAQILKEKS